MIHLVLSPLLAVVHLYIRPVLALVLTSRAALYIYEALLSVPACLFKPVNTERFSKNKLTPPSFCWCSVADQALR